MDKKAYFRNRINEILDFYLMDKNEVRAEVDMKFVRADGCHQEKHLVWSASSGEEKLPEPPGGDKDVEQDANDREMPAR